jgi:hypothetical protein
MVKSLQRYCHFFINWSSLDLQERGSQSNDIHSIPTQAIDEKPDENTTTEIRQVDPPAADDDSDEE